MPWYGFAVCRAYRDLIWSYRLVSAHRNPETHTQRNRDTQKAWQHAHIHKHTTHCSEGPRKAVGMDPALRATQSQSKLMIAQTFTPSIHCPPLSLSHTCTHKKKCLQVVAIIVTTSLTHGEEEEKKCRAFRQKRVEKMEGMHTLSTGRIWRYYWWGPIFKYWWGEQMIQSKSVKLFDRCAGETIAY